MKASLRTSWGLVVLLASCQLSAEAPPAPQSVATPAAAPTPAPKPPAYESPD